MNILNTYNRTLISFLRARLATLSVPHGLKCQVKQWTTLIDNGFGPQKEKVYTALGNVATGDSVYSDKLAVAVMRQTSGAIWRVEW